MLTGATSKTSHLPMDDPFEVLSLVCRKVNWIQCPTSLMTHHSQGPWSRRGYRHRCDRPRAHVLDLAPGTLPWFRSDRLDLHLH